MSDAPEKSEKQFDPTPRRLQKALEDGNVYRSREFASVALLMSGTAVIGLGAPAGMGVLQGMTARVFLD
ncbi:MAG: EscU/YscU/HrcU family type III secretion system export apparatus switch protein, partial [Bacteroidota bacterium]